MPIETLASSHGGIAITGRAALDFGRRSLFAMFPGLVNVSLSILHRMEIGELHPGGLTERTRQCKEVPNATASLLREQSDNELS